MIGCASRVLLLAAIVSHGQSTELDNEGHELVLLQQALSFETWESRIIHDNQPPLDQYHEGCQEDGQDWLFILSAGRSGSTSVLEMVNAIPGYFLGGENGGIMSDFLNLWLKRRDQQAQMSVSAWAPAGETSDNRLLCDLRTYVRDVIGSPADGETMPTTFGFKEVRHSNEEELDMFLKIFPKAKFIINTRNASEQARSGYHGNYIPLYGDDIQVQVPSIVAGDRTEVEEIEEQNNQLTEWGRNHHNVSFFLPMEEFSVTRFNELLDFLGVQNCRFTQVAHANDGNGYTSKNKSSRDPLTLPGIECV